MENIFYFNTSFNIEEIEKEFIKWVEEEHNKRIIKRGKLFSIYYINDDNFLNCYIHFGKNELIYSCNSNDPYLKLYKKYKILADECINILYNICKEYDTQIEIHVTKGTAKEYRIVRK